MRGTGCWDVQRSERRLPSVRRPAPTTATGRLHRLRRAEPPVIHDLPTCGPAAAEPSIPDHHDEFPAFLSHLFTPLPCFREEGVKRTEDTVIGVLFRPVFTLPTGLLMTSMYDRYLETQPTVSSSSLNR